MADSLESVSKPELPQRLQKNKVLRGTLWTATVLVIVFLFLSRTRTYRIYHHRTAIKTLGGIFVTPAKWDWRSYLSPQAFIWLMNYNLTLEEKMLAVSRHTQELMELGYLERRVFVLTRSVDQSMLVARQMESYEGELWTPETVVGLGKDNISVVAPVQTMSKWEAAVKRWEAGGESDPQKDGKR